MRQGDSIGKDITLLSDGVSWGRESSTTCSLRRMAHDTHGRGELCQLAPQKRYRIDKMNFTIW